VRDCAASSIEVSRSLVNRINVNDKDGFPWQYDWGDIRTEFVDSIRLIATIVRPLNQGNQGRALSLGHHEAIYPLTLKGLTKGLDQSGRRTALEKGGPLNDLYGGSGRNVVLIKAEYTRGHRSCLPSATRMA
jgi:hypothetical protein